MVSSLCIWGTLVVKYLSGTIENNESLVSGEETSIGKVLGAVFGVKVSG